MMNNRPEKTIAFSSLMWQTRPFLTEDATQKPNNKYELKRTKQRKDSENSSGIIETGVTKSDTKAHVENTAKGNNTDSTYSFLPLNNR